MLLHVGTQDLMSLMPMLNGKDSFFFDFSGVFFLLVGYFVVFIFPFFFASSTIFDNLLQAQT